LILLPPYFGGIIITDAEARRFTNPHFFFSFFFFFKEGTPRITSIRKFAGASNPLDTATAGSV
jgi:hypothetical protein